MDSKQIEELKKLAEAATPGPWYANDWAKDDGPNAVTIEAREPEVLSAGQSSIWPDGIRCKRVASTDEGEQPLADAAFIAAANPAAVLELIAMIEAKPTPTSATPTRDAVVYACASRDIECGNNAARWCKSCPKRPTSAAEGVQSIKPWRERALEDWPDDPHFLAKTDEGVAAMQAEISELRAALASSNTLLKAATAEMEAMERERDEARAALAAKEQATAESEIAVTASDAEMLINLLDNPPPPNAAMQKAFERFKRENMAAASATEAADVMNLAAEAGFAIDGEHVVALQREGICTRELMKFAELLLAQPPAGGGLPIDERAEFNKKFRPASLELSGPDYDDAEEARSLKWIGWQARAAIKANSAALPTDAARDVLAERARQVSAEGWTPEHDDAYKGDELVTAAACYAVCNLPLFDGLHPADNGSWPWAREWWKPSSRRRNLIKSAALTLAEIERIDRANGSKAE